MANTTMTVEEYIAAQPLPVQPVLSRVRTTLQKALPGAVEGISYRIPVYKLDGRMVLYFAGFRQHYSIYPATPHVITAMKKELAGHLTSKATVRFSYEDPVPAGLIRRFAKLRAAEAAAHERAAATKRTAARKTAPATRAKTARRRARR